MITDPWFYAAAIPAVLLFGIAKGGFGGGLGVLSVPLMALVVSPLQAAAEAIMTTDTFAKWAAAEAEGVRVVGICKGSGMIAPDMATMLGYIFVEAAVDPVWLQSTLSEVAERTFNAVTVDSDTSTSDTVLAFGLGTGPRVEDPVLLPLVFLAAPLL